MERLVVRLLARLTYENVLSAGRTDERTDGRSVGRGKSLAYFIHLVVSLLLMPSLALMLPKPAGVDAAAAAAAAAVVKAEATTTSTTTAAAAAPPPPRLA